LNFKVENFTKAENSKRSFSIVDMRRKKKTTIVTFESRERMTIHRAALSLMSWCDQCGAQVLMVTPNEAALIAGTDTRAILRRVESGQIHFLENASGVLLICKQSLEQAFHSDADLV